MAEEATAGYEQLPPVKPVIHLSPQQAIKLIQVDVRLAPDYLRPTGGLDPRTNLPIDCDPVHIPADVFYQRFKAAIGHALGTDPTYRLAQTILNTVDDSLYQELQQTTLPQAATNFHHTSGPALQTMKPLERFDAVIEARDIYQQHLELLVGVKELQRLANADGIRFSSRVLEAIPDPQALKRAQAVLKVIRDATRNQVASEETQLLATPASLQAHLGEVGSLLSPHPISQIPSLASLDLQGKRTDVPFLRQTLGTDLT